MFSADFVSKNPLVSPNLLSMPAEKKCAQMNIFPNKQILEQYLK
jgi:hypothetical protein